MIIANDPDSDRCSLAEFNHGEWRVFNGNEIGALFGWWIWHEWKNNFNGEARQCYMISSAVSSKILETFAEKEGFNFVETLTGFKWMANCADDLLKKEKTVLFAFEEAIGYMVSCIDVPGFSTFCLFISDWYDCFRQGWNFGSECSSSNGGVSA